MGGKKNTENEIPTGGKYLTISYESLRDTNLSFSTVNVAGSQSIDLVEEIYKAFRKLELNKTKVVKSSSEIQSKWEPTIFAHAFRELFPLGRGGYDEPRSNKMSTNQRETLHKTLRKNHSTRKN